MIRGFYIAAMCEYETLLNQPDEMRLKYFYMIWTLKESYIKAEGKGLSIPLNSFSISITSNSINIIADDGNTKYNFSQSLLYETTVYATCIPS